MIKRKILQNVLDALSDTPVVFIRGARQTGKSTFVQELEKEHYPASYITFDNAGILSAASEDPSGFIANLKKPVILDEVQRVPELLLAIKEDVDKDRQPGQYILTGSANILTIPKVADSLAGRMEIITLWPLAQSEIEDVKDNVIDKFFNISPLDFGITGTTRKHLIEKIINGGYPVPLQRTRVSRKSAWFDSYITTILERDIRDLSNMQDLTALPRILKLLASRVSTLLNQSEISRSAGIPNSTLVRYMTLFEMIFLVQYLPSWSTNLGKRLVKSPKIFLVDTGLVSHLLGYDEKRFENEPETGGKLLENFVISELYKEASWSRTWVQLYHYRSRSGQEVDILLENRMGQVVGIEIKLASTPSPKHFKCLKKLQDELGNRFVKGILFYTGKEVIPFGKNLFAVPIPF